MSKINKSNFEKMWNCFEKFSLINFDNKKN